jgi:signal transduction histidine kinase
VQIPSSDRTADKLNGLKLACGRLFDEVPCYISVQDRSYRVVEANRKLIEDFGDPISRYCHAVYKGRSEPCPECPVARTFADGKEHTSEETIFDRSGLPHDVVVNTRALCDQTGSIVAVMELFTDITVQKELAHRLHDSLNRFHNLFDVVPCYISVQDRDFHIVEANQPFKESFGGRLGDHCYAIYKKRQSRCPVCPVAETFEDGKTHTSEEMVVDRNGRQMRMVVYTAPVRNPQGRIVDVMEVSADITEIRALQDKLATVGGLVAGIAHSIKNVLEGLRGGIYVGNLGFRDANQQDIRTGWEMVERNVTRLSVMISDMLYCAKARSPRRLPVSLAAVVSEVVALYSQRIGDFGIKLDTEIADDLGHILAEPKDIHSLLSNLVGNAIDACCSDQTEEKTHRVVIRVFREPAHAVIEVQDNGPGMDEETRAKLFTMFFSTKGSSGTGLGLMVCHKVATEHRGTVSVKSAPGEGSTFVVKLPLENGTHRT